MTQFPRQTYLLTLLLWLSLLALPVAADEIRVAVASNFLSTLKQLAPQFEAESGHRLRISSGSTGKFYAQIRHGAPFDLLLAADTERPERLVEEGLADAESRFTYAYGRLVLWAPGTATEGCRQRLSAGRFRHLAIANPKTAPYGRVAEELLKQLALWERVRSKLVRGENIVQTLQFVESGNAELGLVAFSLVKGREAEGCLWMVPEQEYRPLAQQAVALTRASEASYSFLTYLRSDAARALIAASGYGIK